MNYELAKQLKDAGFPQKVWSFYLGNYAYNEKGELHLLHVDNDEGGLVGNDYNHREESNHEWTKCPTLSELIEECRKELDEIVIYITDNLVEVKGANPTYGLDLSVEGSTPEEAVANLYLAINKK